MNSSYFAQTCFWRRKHSQLPNRSVLSTIARRWEIFKTCFRSTAHFRDKIWDVTLTTHIQPRHPSVWAQMLCSAQITELECRSGKWTNLMDIAVFFSPTTPCNLRKIYGVIKLFVDQPISQTISRFHCVSSRALCDCHFRFELCPRIEFHEESQEQIIRTCRAIWKLGDQEAHELLILSVPQPRYLRPKWRFPIT